MDFSSHNPKSSNALSLAARRNDVANVIRLLRKIHPNCVDNRGWTCLHEAAFNDSLECLQIILKRGSCRPFVESHEGHTALYVACLHSYYSTRSMKHLLENVDDIANYGSKEGFTPLHLVSRQGREDAVQLLLDHGAMVNVVDFDGDTPLHEACMAKQPEVVNILIHAGAYPELANGKKSTPFHLACSRGCLESVKYLYPFITNINALDCNGDTPLMTACHGENEDVIEFLLERGADPNVVNLHEKMALDLSLERGLVKGFKLLFKATHRDAISTHLAYLALSPGYLKIEIAHTILASDLKPKFFMLTRPWIIEQALDSQTEYYRSIIATKELSSYRTFAPLTNFLNIAEYVYKLSVDKFDEMFCLLMLKGVTVNAKNEFEMPPLVWLQYCPHSECFEYVLNTLVIFGCDVDYCSQMFRTKDKSFGLLNSNSSIFKPYDQLDLVKMNEFPDAFFASMLIDPDTLPAMLTYSLHCDPGYIMKSAYDFGAIDRLPPSTVSKLVKMIDSNCEINDYERFKHYIPPLKHLSRLRVREMIKRKGITKTSHYFHCLSKLPIPKPIEQYLRFA